MNPHFFTAPSFVSFFTPSSKKQEEKGILPPFPPKKISFLKLSCHIHMRLLLPMVFVQVEANKNQKHFHFH